MFFILSIISLVLSSDVFLEKTFEFGIYKLKELHPVNTYFIEVTVQILNDDILQNLMKNNYKTYYLYH